MKFLSEVKIQLSEVQIPELWYNIVPDFSRPIPPPLNPENNERIRPEDLSPLFPDALIQQEMSRERWIAIPDEVRAAYRLWRPTPLFRARRLEKALDTPARIYYKYEGVSPAGSHKANTAVAQAYYNKEEGIHRITTETGAGQWGSALAMACNLFDIESKIYMVKCSYEQKPYRRSMIRLWGGQVIPSPSNETDAGRTVLKEDPNCVGSLGIAISEAVEDATGREDTHYALGSVLNHVVLHQTVIGLEAAKQMEMINVYPDVVIGCVGGGSNFAGLAFPLLRDKLKGTSNTRFVAAESTACPTLTRGVLAYDSADTASKTPFLKMYTLGHTFIPSGIHAGGLRYHGMSPLISHLYDHQLIEAVAYPQTKCFEAAALFAKTELIIPAPEASHAIRAAIDEALRAKAAGERKTILFNLSGHGHLDLSSYEAYLNGTLTDSESPDKAIEEALSFIPKISKA